MRIENLKNIYKETYPFIINSLIFSLIVSILIRTEIIKISFIIIAFILFYSIQSLLFTKEKPYEICLLKIHYQRAILYLIGVIASIIIIYTPAPFFHLKISLNYFQFLNYFQITRVILGYFFTSILPGYAIYTVFLKKENLNFIEKIAIILSISYGVTSIIGIIIKFLNIELNIINILASIWLFILLINIFSIGKREAINIKNEKINIFEIISLCIIIIFLLFHSYTIVLTSDSSGILYHDIARYIESANSFIRENISSLSYVLFQVFIAINSIITGLHPLYAYVGLQYYIILYPISIYYLIRVLFQKNNIASILGMAFSLIFPNVVFSKMAEFYIHYLSPIRVYGALSFLQWRTGLLRVGIIWSTKILYTQFLDYALGIFALAFTYNYLIRNIKKDAFLAVFFTLLALMTHSIFFYSIYASSLLIFILIKGNIKHSISLLITTIFLMMIVEYQNLIGYFYTILFNKEIYIPYIWNISIISIISIISFLLIKNILKKKKIKIKKYKFLSKENIQFILLIIIALAYLSSVINDYYFEYSTYEYAIHPWFKYFHNYGLALLIIVFLSTTIKNNYDSLLYIFSWIGGITVSVIISYMLYALLPPMAWFNRLMEVYYLPLSCLLSFEISNLPINKLNGYIKLFKKPQINISYKQIVSFLIMLTLIPAYLMSAYNTEFHYYNNNFYTTPQYKIETYEWIKENTEEKSCFLTYTYDSKLSLTSLTQREAISYEGLFPFNPPPWEIRALLYSQLPEVWINIINKLKITHSFLQKRDLDWLLKLKISSWINFLESLLIIYQNQDIKIHKLPKNILSNSNYVLVLPTLDLVYNKEALKYYQLAFNMLASSNITFNLISDIELKELKKDFVYVFPINEYIPKKLYSNIINSIYEGTNIIILKKSFGIKNEFSQNLKNISEEFFKIKEENKTKINRIIFENGSYIELGELEVPKIEIDKNVKILACYSFNNTEITPYIAYKKIGKGSITIIFIDLLIEKEDLQNINKYNLYIKTIQSLINLFPKNMYEITLTRIYPNEIFEFFKDIYNKRKDYGYILFLDDIEILGETTIEAPYIILNAYNESIQKIIFKEEDIYENFNNLTLAGYAKVKIKAKEVKVLNEPTSYLAKIKIKGPATINIVGENLNEKLEYQNITIYIKENNEIEAILKQPIISINGKVKSTWQGAFWHENMLYTTSNNAEKWIMEGNFKIETIYYSKIILSKIMEINKIILEK